MAHIIRDVKREELKTSARVVRESFKTVAAELNLTRENAPTHPSFTTVADLRKSLDDVSDFFGLFVGDIQVGFVVAEKAGDGLFYMKRLAVLPGHRHKGYGDKLVGYVIAHARKRGGKMLSIAIIDEHIILKDWYRAMGFVETSTSVYPHLPFTVCFMEKEI